MASNHHHVPAEIIESIVLHLPVKSLLRFKSISKSWNAMISDRVFIRNHMMNNSKSQNLFVREMGRSGASFLSLVKLMEDGKLQTVDFIYHPLVTLDHLLSFSEYGVLLFIDFCSRTCIVWNACTKRIVTTLSFPDEESVVLYHGIFYDAAVDDFKVVFVYDHWYAVYSCNNKSWSDTKQHPLINIPYYAPSELESSGVSIDGAIYWLMSDAYIMYYDASDDKLKILHNMKDAEYPRRRPSYLVNLGGHLSLYDIYGDGELDKMYIWIKETGTENNSWKELIIIHKTDVGGPVWLLEPLCFLANTNKLLLCYRDDFILSQRSPHDDHKLVIYNPLDKTCQKVEDKIVGVRSLIPYRDTLFRT